jgi:putative ABC transport system substrate-binding protein
VRRREFITLLGGAAAAWPFVARAQQTQQRVPVVGILGTTTPSAWDSWTSAFVLRLRELGWIEGRNISIEYRWAEGRSERYAEIAAEFVRLQVNVIVTTGPAILTLKQATSVIPIVFATANDPVGTGKVASLARPGGNITGTSIQNTETAGKRVEILRELIPGLRRLAIMGNVGYPAAVLEMGEIGAAATKLGLEVVTLEIRRGEDIPTTFESINGRADALAVVPTRSYPPTGLASTRCCWRLDCRRYKVFVSMSIGEA